MAGDHVSGNTRLAGDHVSGNTRLAGVLGWPVGHSLSPAIHNAAYREMGEDIVYVAFPVQPADLACVVDGLRHVGVVGLSVTMPHKEAVVSLLDEQASPVAALGAANTVVNQSGRLVGHSTDGTGLVAALLAEHGFDPRGQRCVVIGAGGASRSIIAALASAGAVDIAVLNRSPARAEAAAHLAPAARVGSPEDVHAADLVINTTPLGMNGADDLPADSSLIRAGQLVVDAIYYPARTRFSAAATLAGAETMNGLPMLIHQAAQQIKLWTGHDAPIATMRSAIE